MMLTSTLITILGLSATALSVAVPVQQANVTEIGERDASELVKRSGTYKAFLTTLDCTGSSDFTWTPQLGCFSFNGNRDMYSILFNGVNICQSGNYRLTRYIGSFNCQGASTTGTGGGGATCFNNNGNSFKSFKVECA